MPSPNATPTPITPPRVPLIDPRTGYIDRAWYLFFLSLNNVASAVIDDSGITFSSESLLASYDAALQALAQEVETQPPVVILPVPDVLGDCCSALESQVAEMQKQIEAIDLSSYSAALLSQVAEIQKQIEAIDLSNYSAPLLSQIAEMQKQIEAIDLASYCAALTSQTTEMQKQIEALQVQPISTPELPQYIYGSFYSTANQPDGSITTAYPLLYDTTQFSKNVTLEDRTAVFTASIGPASTTMIVTAITSGPIYPGMTITGTGVTAGTRIVSQTTGTDGSTGTYVVSALQIVVSTTITGTCKSKIKCSIEGTYNVQFSIQMVNTDANVHDIDVWMRKNGTDVIDSNSQFSIPSKHGSVNGHLIGALNLFIDLAADEYVELMWSTSDTTTTIEYLAAQTSPVRPATPSVILTVSLVSAPIFQGV